MDLVPDIKELISHSLCYEELMFDHDQGQVYKDLALLAFNRTIFSIKTQNDSDEEDIEDNHDR